MPIEKVNIPTFEGVNVNLRPDLIKDSQASEMINLRFNRLGALVSRNGVIAYNVPDSFAAQPAGLNNKGCVAIGEFILTATDNDSQDIRGYGTDRFMVYALRQSTIDSSDTELPTRHTMQYVMCPMTGPYKNRLQQTVYSKAFLFSETAAGETNTDRLVAPRRELENLEEWQSATGELHDQNWIEHYGKMNQYGNALVISDRTNGDMLLIDAYNEAEPGTTGKHEFRLQENSKAQFDVDTVDLDFGLNVDGFNAKGVKNGLALYQFHLPRKNALSSRDYFSDYWQGSDANVSDRLENTIGFLLENQIPKNPLNTNGVKEYAQNGTFITAGVWASRDIAEIRQVIPIGIGVNQDNQYVFSDIDEPTQIDDLLGELTFTNPLSSDKLEQAADVYVWDDLEMTYYPCSGKDIGGSYLRSKDREFTKTAPLLPKISKLKTKLGMEQEVPLGVWRYRFVWDMGNGEYSNPSSELSIPDTLWSTMTDDVLEDSLAANDKSYERPAKQRQSDAITQPRPVIATQVNMDLTTAAPIVFDAGYNLTEYGRQLKKIKDKLYAGTDNRFARYIEDNVPAMEHALRSELGVIVTSKFGSGGDKIDCKGFVLEGASFFSNAVIRYRYPLSIPLFRGNFQEMYNSVFADNGAYRVAWQNKPEYVTDYRADRPSWQIVLWGHSIAAPTYTTTYNTIQIDILKFKALPGIFFNVVPLESALAIDQNNAPEPSGGYSGNTLASYRIATQFRAVKNEVDRLANIAADIPAQVTSRLLLQGVSELVLADPSMPGTITNATDMNNEELLHHDMARKFRWMQEFPSATTPDVWSWNGINALDDHSAGFYGQTETIDGKRCVYNTNVTVAIHGAGERLTIPEQLTSYFPSSLLFGAPRVKLKVKAENVPARAKRLMIFRTLASHDNNWVPEKFGLVKSVKVPRNITTKDIEDIEFLDDVKDKDLDFGLQLDEFQGLTHPLKSRFNLPLNETMYYANFLETYQPPAPRSGVEVENGGELTYYANGSTTDTHTTYSQNVMWTRLSSEDFTAAASRRVLYVLLNKDASGVYSQPAMVSANDEPIDVGVGQAICLVNAPQPSGLADEVEVWRGTEVGSLQYKWELIGTIAKDMEGIFLDDNKEAIAQWEGTISEDTGIITVAADEVENPSGLRNSEPYQPSNTRLESLYSVRSGDGDQITGIEQLYGNLVVFKERSIHRIAVQSTNPPYSRTDEISNRIGCIAPNTILSHNNDIYFLSWSGFYRYNNNVLQKADGDFWAELERRINNFQLGVDDYGQSRNPGVRDASCAYNPVYNEIYLNVPIYEYDAAIAPDIEAANHSRGSRKMRGHVYVIQLESGLVSKFHYEQNGTPPDRTQGRLYHTNSLGELRSAQILSDDLNTRPALVCLEAPTETAVDNTSDHSYVAGEWKFGGQAVNTLWRSKHFTLNDKSIVKRVIKVLGNVRNGEYIRMSGGTQNEAYNSYNHAESKWWEYEFDLPGELTAIPPRTSSPAENDDSRHPERGERVAFQIETQGDTMIDNFSFYWRPVDQYMR